MPKCARAVTDDPVLVNATMERCHCTLGAFILNLAGPGLHFWLQVRPDDLVLVDAGAEHRCYTADISRTFPASGRYSAAQRDVYNATLDVQASTHVCFARLRLSCCV